MVWQHAGLDQVVHYIILQHYLLRKNSFVLCQQNMCNMFLQNLFLNSCSVANSMISLNLNLTIDITIHFIHTMIFTMYSCILSYLLCFYMSYLYVSLWSMSAWHYFSSHVLSHFK